jgi:hypothetical protein
MIIESKTILTNPIPAPLGVWFVCSLLSFGISTSPMEWALALMILIEITVATKIKHNFMYSIQNLY